MSSENDAPWGKQSFARERYWYRHLPTDPVSFDTKQDYHEHRTAAIADPAYDLFERFLPSGRPKADIGRYVMRYGVNVPLITSMPEWQEALNTGHAMLRSELPQDYDGYSGLLSSIVIPQRIVYPKNTEGTEDTEWGFNNHTNRYEERQLCEGPVQVKPDLLTMDLLDEYNHLTIGDATMRRRLHDMLADGLYDGTANPTAIMRLLRWNDEERGHYFTAPCYGFEPVDLRFAEASRWRFVPGINVRVFRDPVIEGKYFIGGQEAHHHWETTEGHDTPDLEAYDKGVYRGYSKPGTPEYTLPAAKIIDLYEKVRTLPYFDQRQAPVMEFQYGDDGNLYFLQYLKTGLQISDPGEFALPTTHSSVMIHEARGATGVEGMRVRMYLDPDHLSRSMEREGILMGDSLSRTGHAEQVAATKAAVAVIDYGLCFKDNHYGTAALTRSPVTLSLWDGVGDAEKQFRTLSRPSAPSSESPIAYIEALVTSNGRKATVDSDWVVRYE